MKIQPTRTIFKTEENRVRELSQRPFVGVWRQVCQSACQPAYRRGSCLGLLARDDVDRVSVCDARLFQIQLRLEEVSLEQNGLHERTRHNRDKKITFVAVHEERGGKSFTLANIG